MILLGVIGEPFHVPLYLCGVPFESRVNTRSSIVCTVINRART